MRVFTLFLLLLSGCTSTDWATNPVYESSIDPTPQNIEIRLLCYDRMLPLYDEPIFIDATIEEIDILKRNKESLDIRPIASSSLTKKDRIPQDNETKEWGSWNYIEELRIEDDEAWADFTWYASPGGAEFYTIHLKRNQEEWEILEVENTGAF